MSCRLDCVLWPWYHVGMASGPTKAGEESILCNSGLCFLGSFLPVLCPLTSEMIRYMGSLQRLCRDSNQDLGEGRRCS